jgi:hypothetical protein
MIRDNLDIEVAVLISLLLHAMAFGSWQYRETLARFPLFRPLARMASVSHRKEKPATPSIQTLTFVQVREPAKKKVEAAPAKQFMETVKSQVTGQQPKDAKYYSENATVAANPENPTGKKGETPFLEGTETRVMSAKSVPFDAGVPAPPAPPAPPPAAAAKPAPAVVEPPKAVVVEGLKKVEEKKTTLLAHSTPAPPPVIPVAPPAPAIAPAAVPEQEVAALKSKLTATGVSARGVAAFNVASSPFGEYDKKIVTAVQSRWYALIQRYGVYERAGTVIIHFELHDDGSVKDLSREENSAGEILALFCEKAVVDSAPFDPLPDSLRVLVGKEPRDVNFTFYY